jgi:transcriptional regulator
MPTESLDLVQGTVDVLVLQTLAWGPMHGYAVASWIRQRTDGVLELEDAPLYKALHRLERQGCVVAEWGLSENNRRARYYQLTPAGAAQLSARASAWRRYADAVCRVLEPPRAPGTARP